MSSKKISHDDDLLDFTKLDQEVQSAVVNEEKYWRENDAKIRAVEQRVPTYDDFREMVLAAHLKPLEKEDKMNNIKNFTQIWNQPAKSGPKSDVQDFKTKLLNNAQSVKGSVNSGPEFVQQWKRCCKTAEEKKQFLLSFDAPKLLSIFKVEIAGGLLGEFIECFQNFEDDEATVIINCLDAFSKSQRFSLSKTFLSIQEKELCIQLFQRLLLLHTVDKELHDKLEELENLYC